MHPGACPALTGNHSGWENLTFCCHQPTGVVTTIGDTMARVLVIEDDASLAMLLSYLLGHEGHDVEVCVDGDEAVARLDGEPADAVLVDVMLPSEISGLDVLRELRRRADWAEVPAIIVSALSGDEHQWEGWAAGASSYVTKPYDSEHLLEVLDEHLGVAALRRDLAGADGRIDVPEPDLSRLG